MKSESVVDGAIIRAAPTNDAYSQLVVLSQLDEINVCTAYEIDGRRVSVFPSHVDDLRRAVPVYETLPGWQEEISSQTDFKQLPERAKQYVKRLSELVGVPLEIVSVGPDRDQTMMVEHA